MRCGCLKFSRPNQKHDNLLRRRQNKFEGNNVEITAMSCLYQCKIEVYMVKDEKKYDLCKSAFFKQRKMRQLCQMVWMSKS